MIESISTEWRTARKEHKCNYCNGVIHPGERYERSVNKYDGDVYCWNSHEKCSYIAGEIWDYADPDEGMDDDLFYESCSDICRTFVCPDCGKWDTDECDVSYCLDKVYDLLKAKELYRDRRDGWGNSYWKVRDREKKQDG